MGAYAIALASGWPFVIVILVFWGVYVLFYKERVERKKWAKFWSDRAESCEKAAEQETHPSLKKHYEKRARELRNDERRVRNGGRFY